MFLTLAIFFSCLYHSLFNPSCNLIIRSEQKIYSSLHFHCFTKEALDLIKGPMAIPEKKPTLGFADRTEKKGPIFSPLLNSYTSMTVSDCGKSLSGPFTISRPPRI